MTLGWYEIVLLYNKGSTSRVYVKQVLEGIVEPQISHFANFTPFEELVPKRHFWKMWNLRMVNFDNFWGLTSVLKFHIFLIFNCKELVRIGVICEGLVRFFLRCEELVLNFHKCEESVPFLHTKFSCTDWKISKDSQSKIKRLVFVSVSTWTQAGESGAWTPKKRFLVTRLL